MSTTEETIARVHSRAGEMHRNRLKRRLRVEGAITAALGACMIAMVLLVGTTSGPFVGSVTTDTGFAGASMLDASVGGYVIVGVLAFLFGVALTMLIRTHHKKKGLEE